MTQEKGCGKMLFQRTKKNSDGIGDMTTDRKERKCSLHSPAGLPAPMGGLPGWSAGKVSFCISLLRKASLAVETALVLPLFFLGLITLISFMDIYRLQTEHLQALCEKTKEAGMYTYVLNGRGPEKITLPDVYAYTPVGGIIALPKVWMHNTVTVHAWTGSEQKFSAGKEEQNEKMVYVTESGSVYHREAGCRYLNLSLNQVPGSRVASMRNSYGEKYSPCEICSRGQDPAGSVFVTESGNRYHNLESCSGLKRTVKLVKQSDVHGMKPCSSCG